MAPNAGRKQLFLFRLGVVIMDGMTIISAKYNWDKLDNKKASIQATIDGVEMSVPLDPANRHYAEIMRQVNEGTLVIQPAKENN